MGKKVLVTGAEGFIGRNLCVTLARIPELLVLKYDVRNTTEDLADFANDADFVIHLAGVMRPANPEEHKIENADFTSHLLALLRTTGRRVPVLMTSSIQAALDNPYGASKRMAEDAVFAYGKETGSEVCVYRLTNAFGKWCRPNYNSAVATWCYNIARDLPIQVRDPEASLTLVYVDDVVTEFVSALNGQANHLDDGYCGVPVAHTRTLGQITESLYAFKASRQTLVMPELKEPFERDLYATFLTYMPEDSFRYDLPMKRDDRGWLAEFIKSEAFGQIFVSRTKPGITRGNHWHHTKVEKFLVVEGDAVIRFRHIERKEIFEFKVSGNLLKVVDIPAGYTHTITNAGETEMITLFWASEIFDSQRPDTFFEKV